MRIPTHHDRRFDDDEQRAMTPMIDAVFLLLIFFVCASVGQSPEETFTTELGSGTIEADSAVFEQDPLKNFWLRLFVVDNQTQAEVNNSIFSDLSKLKPVLKQLAELAPDTPVVLDIEQEVVLEDVLSVYDTCRSAGFESINFAVEPSRKPRSRSSFSILRTLFSKMGCPALRKSCFVQKIRRG